MISNESLLFLIYVYECMSTFKIINKLSKLTVYRCSVDKVPFQVENAIKCLISYNNIGL